MKADLLGGSGRSAALLLQRAAEEPLGRDPVLETAVLIEEIRFHGHDELVRLFLGEPFLDLALDRAVGGVERGDAVLAGRHDQLSPDESPGDAENETRVPSGVVAFLFEKVPQSPLDGDDSILFRRGREVPQSGTGLWLVLDPLGDGFGPFFRRPFLGERDRFPARLGFRRSLRWSKRLFLGHRWGPFQDLLRLLGTCGNDLGEIPQFRGMFVELPVRLGQEVLEGFQEVDETLGRSGPDLFGFEKLDDPAGVQEL